MSGLKAIRRRIQSVKSTKQITRAMKLVSAAKLRRAQDAAANGRIFSDRIDAVVGRVMGELSDGISHPLLEPRPEVKVRRIVLVSGERGLCGAYNTNILKAFQAELNASSAKVQAVAVGRRAGSALRRMEGVELVSSYEGLAEVADRLPIEEVAREQIEDFLTGKCDEVVVIYTSFVSAMTQRVTREVLLPLGKLAGGTAEVNAQPVKFGSNPAQILANLIPLVLRMRILKAMLESKASEHAARMTAMDSATSNASDLIDRLQLFYNRARQTTITRELIDIVGGAEAIS